MERSECVDAKDSIRQSFQIAQMTVDMLLADLSDADLLVRSTTGANHIAWQLGHVIASENEMLGQIQSGAGAKLPDGFAAKHSGETAGIDASEKFYTKAEYVRLLGLQRQSTLAVLDSIDPKRLDEPAPEPLRQIVPTVGGVFNLMAAHVTMHAGQFTPIRRKLGKPVAF
jgi:hypothetical protein